VRPSCLLALLVMATGCDRSGAPIKIVIPKNYTGPISIVLASEGEEIPLVDGTYLVEIPADGVLRVKSFRPFERWHQQSACYDDGSPLPSDDEPNPAAANVVALRGGASAVTEVDGKEIRWLDYFVGTEQEFYARPLRDAHFFERQ